MMEYSIHNVTRSGFNLATLLGFMVLAGCGGGGGGSSGPEVISSTLDNTSVQTLASKAVAEAECSGISGIAVLPSLNMAARDTEDSSLTQPVTLASRVSDYTTLISGLISGTFSKTGDHSNGTDTLTYQYTDYTNPVGGLVLEANGSASVIYHGVPGDYGPVVSNKTVSTNGPIAVSKSPNTSARSAQKVLTTTDYEVSVSGLNQIYATIMMSADDLVIDNVRIKNLDTGQVYSIDKLTAKGYFSNTMVTLGDLSYTYTSSDVGTLQVTSDAVVVTLDGMKIPSSIQGTLTMTATDGTQAETVIESNGNVKIYTVNNSVKTLTSEVDCSSLVH